MAANIHPPILTDVISNPAYHSMEAFWQQVGSHTCGFEQRPQYMDCYDRFDRSRYFGEEQARDVPRGSQNFWEVVVSTLEDIVVQTMGRTWTSLFPFDCVSGAFILGCNLIGILPWFQSSTNNLNTTLALALVAFTVTHYGWNQRARHALCEAFPRDLCPGSSRSCCPSS